MTVESSGNPATLPDPVPFERWVFRLAGGFTTEVMIFPDDGDTVERTAESWVFSFPRLDTQEEIFRPILGLSVQKGKKRVMTREQMEAEVKRRKAKAKLG